MSHGDMHTERKRSESFDYAKPSSMRKQATVPWVKTVQVGFDILRNPHHNKGLGFTWNERRELKLHGLLPPVYRDIAMQAKEVMWNLDRMKDPLDQYIYIMNLLNVNEKLFYYVLRENLPTLMPIVYTPTVGLACEKFGYIYTHPRGMWITIKDIGRVYQMLKNWPEDDIRAICVTDGERILGLGDLGAFGMGIPIGKLGLYTGCAGIKPHQLLPVLIDVGTDREELRKNEFYIGLRQPRDRTQKYDELLEEFMKAVTHRFGPATLIQFEDFGNSNAFRLLQKFRNHYCTFNDDIQGTAAVVLAGMYASLKIKGTKLNKLSSHVYLMYGAGSAGVGIANLIVSGIIEETKESVEEARKHIWLVDSKGLVFKNRPSGGIDAVKTPFAHEWNGGEIQQLDKIVKAVKATAIFGISGQPKTFTESVCKAVYANNEHPIIFPMSNPTSKSECSAEEAYKWTNNKCIFASGSPFPSLHVGNKTIAPAQANNAYIFPGFALGIIAGRVSRVTDEMFLIAAQTLANVVPQNLIDDGILYPPLSEINQVSIEIATATVKKAYEQNVANQIPPENIRDLVLNFQYDHKNFAYYSDPLFENLHSDYN